MDWQRGNPSAGLLAKVIAQINLGCMGKARLSSLWVPACQSDWAQLYLALEEMRSSLLAGESQNKGETIATIERSQFEKLTYLNRACVYVI